MKKFQIVICLFVLLFASTVLAQRSTRPTSTKFHGNGNNSHVVNNGGNTGSGNGNSGQGSGNTCQPPNVQCGNFGCIPKQECQQKRKAARLAAQIEQAEQNGSSELEKMKEEIEKLKKENASAVYNYNQMKKLEKENSKLKGESEENKDKISLAWLKTDVPLWLVLILILILAGTPTVFFLVTYSRKKVSDEAVMKIIGSPL